MKTLELNQIENITGGDFWDGFCGGAGLGLSLASLMVAVPGVNIAGGILGGACLAYTLLR